MMDLCKIFDTLNLIHGDNPYLLPVTDLNNDTVSTTEEYEKASSSDEIGRFFSKMIIENQLSSKEIKTLQKSFAVIKEKKKTKQMIDIAKRLLPPMGVKLEEDLEYQKLLQEESASDEVEAKLQVMFRAVEMEEEIALNTLKHLFPEDKNFILEKVHEQVGLSADELIANIRKMRDVGIEKVQALIKEINDLSDLKHPTKSSDSSAFRKLKQRLSAGVKFSGVSRRLVYDTYESPEETAQRIAGKQVSERTKTRTNIPSMAGIGKLMKPSLDNLRREVKPLNETTLCIALMTEIKTFTGGIANTMNSINRMIDKFNKDLKDPSTDMYETLTAANEIMEWIDFLRRESVNNFKLLCDGRAELKERCRSVLSENLYWITINEGIFEKLHTTREKNHCFVHLEVAPGITEYHDFALIDQLLREAVFKTAKKVRAKELLPNKAKDDLHQELLEKACTRDELSDGYKRDYLEAALDFYLKMHPESVAIINRLFESCAIE